MVDVSDSKLKQMLGKPWSAWNLPGCSTEMGTLFCNFNIEIWYIIKIQLQIVFYMASDSVKLREAYKPKELDKPRDQCNLLPHSCN